MNSDMFLTLELLCDSTCNSIFTANDVIINAVSVKQRRCYYCLMYESHRCQNENNCPDGLHYEKYKGSTVRQCLCATVEEFQDGYIHCPILECIGCGKCMQDFGDGANFRYDESQNYERKPKIKSYETKE